MEKAQFNIVPLKDSVQVWFGTKLFVYGRDSGNTDSFLGDIRRWMRTNRKKLRAKEKENILRQIKTECQG